MNKTKRTYNLRSNTTAVNENITNRRNSFDQFGDDLCEEILQYLSFADKARYECVSKQWKHCVFARQYQLCVHITDPNNPCDARDRYKYYHYNTFNELPLYVLIEYDRENKKTVNKALAMVLSKCPFINDIFIGINNYDKQIFVTIVDNCKRLTSMRYNPDDYDGKTIRYLGEKCGKNMKSIVFSDHENTAKCRQLMKLCPNLLRIRNCEVNDLTFGDEVLVPKLSEVISLNGCDKTRLMDLFIKRYANTIKVFTLTKTHGQEIADINKQLNQISCLTKLINLKIEISNQELLPVLQQIENIGHKCKEMKYLEIRNRIFAISCHTKGRYDKEMPFKYPVGIFNSLRLYKNLVHLKLFLPYFHGDTFRTDLSLRDCEQLTNIDIRATITDSFFVDIHQYLPKLQVIKIETKRSLTDVALNSLAKLKHLKSLHFDTNDSVFTENGLNAFANCVHFNSLTLRQLPEIKIKKLIEIAIKNSRINFSYHTYKQLKFSKKEMPKNIEIIIQRRGFRCGNSRVM